MGLKRLGREVDHSFPSSAEVRKKCNYVSAPPVGLYGVCTDNNTLYHLRMLIISPSVFTNCPLNLSNFPEWPDQNINLIASAATVIIYSGPVQAPCVYPKVAEYPI